MNFKFYLDNVETRIESDPLMKFSHYLRLAHPRVYFSNMKEFIFLDNNLYAADYLPIYRLQGKKVETSRGFFKSPNYQEIIHSFLSHHQRVCPLCFEQRFFLAYHASEMFQNSRELRIRQVLKWIPCFCQQDKEIYEFFISNHQDKRHG